MRRAKIATFFLLLPFCALCGMLPAPVLALAAPAQLKTAEPIPYTAQNGLLFVDIPDDAGSRVVAAFNLPDVNLLQDLAGEPFGPSGRNVTGAIALCNNSNFAYKISAIDFDPEVAFINKAILVWHPALTRTLQTSTAADYGRFYSENKALVDAVAMGAADDTAYTQLLLQVAEDLAQPDVEDGYSRLVKDTFTVNGAYSLEAATALLVSNYTIISNQGNPLYATQGSYFDLASYYISKQLYVGFSGKERADLAKAQSVQQYLAGHVPQQTILSALGASAHVAPKSTATLWASAFLDPLQIYNPYNFTGLAANMGFTITLERVEPQAPVFSLGPATSPQTGDSAPTRLFAGIAVVSLGALLFLLHLRRTPKSSTVNYCKEKENE